MSRVGFEPTIQVFERAKTVHALDRATTVTGPKSIQNRKIYFFIVILQAICCAAKLFFQYDDKNGSRLYFVLSFTATAFTIPCWSGLPVLAFAGRPQHNMWYFIKTNKRREQWSAFLLHILYAPGSILGLEAGYLASYISCHFAVRPYKWN
jgi:hypothetical protein